MPYNDHLLFYANKRRGWLLCVSDLRAFLEPVFSEPPSVPMVNLLMDIFINRSIVPIKGVYSIGIE
jgi:hypothetical protein